MAVEVAAHPGLPGGLVGGLRNSGNISPPRALALWTMGVRRSGVTLNRRDLHGGR